MQTGRACRNRLGSRVFGDRTGRVSQRIRCMTPLLATGREVAKLGRWQDIGRTRSAGAR